MYSNKLKVRAISVYFNVNKMNPQDFFLGNISSTILLILPASSQIYIFQLRS
jgi:hypothetical protein